MNDAEDIAAFFIGIFMLIVGISSWLTHVIVCLLQAKYVLLLAGAIVFPVGMIHGIGLWFGVSW